MLPRAGTNTALIIVLIALASLLLTAISSLPVGYALLQYYIPANYVLLPSAIQTFIVSVGTSVAILWPTSCVAGAAWASAVLLDWTMTLLVWTAVYPGVMKVISEPDGSVNMYLAWIQRLVLFYISAGVIGGLARTVAFVLWWRRRGCRVSSSDILGAPRRATSGSDGAAGGWGGGSAVVMEGKNDAFVDGAAADEGETVVETEGITLVRKHDDAGNDDKRLKCTRIARALFLTVAGGAAVWSLVVICLGASELGTALKKEVPATGLPKYTGASSSEASTLRSECDPLVSFACALPFPSSFYLTEDPSTATGKRVDLKRAMPSTRWASAAEGAAASAGFVGGADGFSTVAPILFAFDSEVDSDSLVSSPSNISRSTVVDETTTFLIDEKGELCAHFVEKDVFDPEFGLSNQPDAQRRMLVMQPAQALKWNTTYIVAVRGLRSGGVTLEARRGVFAALRDGDTDSPEFSPSRAKIMDQASVWPTLERAGLQRNDPTLLLAFSFTTTSRHASLGPFEAVREAAFAAAAAADKPGVFTVTSVVDHADGCSNDATATIARTVHGHFQSPNFLVTPGPDRTSGWANPSAPEAGINGESTVGFLVRIPCSVWTGKRPTSLVLQYGHGMFGSRAEAMDPYLGRVANDFGFIVVATDWKGMSRTDIPMALRIFLKRAAEFPGMPQRTQQGWIDNALFLKLVRGRLASDPALTTAAGAPLVSASTAVAFYGNSQGSIVGGGYFSSSQELTRAVLGVPGTPFALLLSRSKDFAPYDAAIKLQIWTQVDLRIFMSLFQLAWDRAETGGWLHNIVAPSVTKGYPRKKAVLMQAALGDAQVTTVAAEFLARSLHAATIRPETRYVYGLTEREAPFDAEDQNAFVEYSYLDAPPVPRDRDVPPTDGRDTHECPRREKRTQLQLNHFLVDGVVMQPCTKGICESPTCPDGKSDN